MFGRSDSIGLIWSDRSDGSMFDLRRPVALELAEDELGERIVVSKVPLLRLVILEMVRLQQSSSCRMLWEPAAWDLISAMNER